MVVNNAASAAEFVAAWMGESLQRAKGAIAFALDGQRRSLAIERSYPKRYDSTGTLAAIDVLERALADIVSKEGR